MKKIMIADDHPLFRRGLRSLINFEFKLSAIVEVGSFNDLLQELQIGYYTHLIVDISLNDVNLSTNFLALRRQFPGLAVLIFSMYPSSVHGHHLIRAGARGYINKQSTNEEVIACLEQFFTGHKYLQEKPDDRSNPFNKLSSRELEVLSHLLSGLCIKEISALMHLKPNTVATFKSRIFDKLGVKNPVELNQLANLYYYEHI